MPDWDRIRDAYDDLARKQAAEASALFATQEAARLELLREHGVTPEEFNARFS
ncbi:MAG: hypothetical protein IAI48_00495 [Candidatus Eremiobacteraeota bacterium]|nr:hypothetical protein [Candidatus Eremiobacteraeota bacterium]